MKDKCRLCKKPLDHDIDSLKTSKHVKDVINKQIQEIRRLSGLHVQIDGFYSDGKPLLFELNFYMNYDRQYDLIRHGLDYRPKRMVSQLQDVIDVMYVMKYHEPAPRMIDYSSELLNI